MFWGLCALMPPPTHRLTNEYEQSVLGRSFSLLLQFHDILSTYMHHSHPQDLPGLNSSFCGLYGKSITELNWSRVPLRGTQALRFRYYFILQVEREETSHTVSATLKTIWRLLDQTISLLVVVSASMKTSIKKKRVFQSPCVTRRQFMSVWENKISRLR